MRGDLGPLYDAHADRLYAYCWSLVGDRLAAAALGDTFSAAVHQPPRGDSVLWLYSLARTACADRGAFTGSLDGRAAGGRGGPLFAAADPLLRAAGGLRSDHREVLLLQAGEWLEPHDIARVLGIAPDTVMQLLAAARTRLERAVLDILMRGAAESRLDLIAAFEKGRLPQLLARRAPSRAPGELRDRVLAACEEEATRPLPSVAAPTPLVVIGAERARTGRAGDRPKRGLSGGISRGVGAAAGVAASAAAVIGLLVSWPAARGGGDSASLVPTASNGRTHPASALSSGVPQHPLPGLPGSERATGGTPATPADPVAGASAGSPRRAGTPGGGATPAPPANSPSGTPSEGKKPVPDTPGRPEKPSTPPEKPTTPPSTPSDPATPPDDGSTPPATPPTDTPPGPPADDTGTPSPSPTSNPAPQPGQG
ncbi:RNA polymerase sigma factor [Actinomadura formosensis]|uniref:RNA polymerase sigma factor n=1 Tax=Actinomadura formosensis TaxID=60706 RepID=UPI000833C5F6|nr:RNA polymerase sigma factor [Actinomadura formosensis]